MKKSYSIKVLFLCTVLYLPLQFYVCLKVQEPYPAIVLPGFGGGTDLHKQEYSYTKDYHFLLFDGGDSVYIRANELLPFSSRKVHVDHIVTRLIDYKIEEKYVLRSFSLGKKRFSFYIEEEDKKRQYDGFLHFLEKRATLLTNVENVDSFHIVMCEEKVFMQNVNKNGDEICKVIN